MSLVPIPACCQRLCTTKTPDARSIAVAVGYAFVIGMLGFILIRTGNQSQADMRTKLAQYQSVALFENTHTPGGELAMVPMEAGKDSLLDCIVLCDQRRAEGCTAVNHYPPRITPNKIAQCWLLNSIPADRIGRFDGITLAVTDRRIIPNSLKPKP